LKSILYSLFHFCIVSFFSFRRALLSLSAQRETSIHPVAVHSSMPNFSNNILFFFLIRCFLHHTNCQFHQHYMREYFVRTSYRQLFITNIRTYIRIKKLPKWRLFKKFVRKMLMKLTTSVNFTNILWAKLFCTYNFWWKEIVKKML